MTAARRHTCGQGRCDFEVDADDPLAAMVLREHLATTEAFSHYTDPTLDAVVADRLGHVYTREDCRYRHRQPVRAVYRVKGRGACRAHVHRLIEAAVTAGMDPAPIEMIGT